jgi:hypothetical protein
MIKNDINTPECFKEMQVIFFSEASRRNTCLFSTNYDRRPVVVGPADEYDFLARPSQVPDIKISRNIGTKMPEVAGTVGIRESACHQYWFPDHHTIS